jgi:hypothetical protein
VSTIVECDIDREVVKPWPGRIVWRDWIAGTVGVVEWQVTDQGRMFGQVVTLKPENVELVE